MSSRFANVPQRIFHGVFNVGVEFHNDPFEGKIDLLIGAYKSDEGKPWVLPVVRKAEKALIADETLNKEYPPITGIDGFSKAAVELVLGNDHPAIQENRVFSAQCLSACGALRVGAQFLADVLNYRVFCKSMPSYDNYTLVFTEAGFTQEIPYRYWSLSKRKFDCDGMVEDLRNAPENAVVLLQNCAHCPTGCDPTEDEWMQIADVIEEKKLFPFFDCVYQGMASGDLDKDAWPIRYFASRGFEMLIAQSFSKNMGLYGERIGSLSFVLADANPQLANNIKTQFCYIARSMYTSPPLHGARIVNYILHNPDLVQEWKQNVKTMASRIQRMRKALREALERLNVPGDWSHITRECGFFYNLGLNVEQSKHMIKKHHVYILHSGRINVCGLTPNNVEAVARAMKETLENVH